MPDYRRFRVPGGTYFFTVNLLERRLDTLVRHIDALREAVRVTRVRRNRPAGSAEWNRRHIADGSRGVDLDLDGFPPRDLTSIRVFGGSPFGHPPYD